jgi:hypothetical protein
VMPTGTVLEVLAGFKDDSDIASSPERPYPRLGRYQSERTVEGQGPAALMRMSSDARKR